VLVTRAKLRLADLTDLLRIYTDLDFGVIDTDPSVHDTLPPPGMTLVYDPLETPTDPGVPFPYLWAEVAGDDSSLTPGDLYYVPFGVFAAHLTSVPYADHLAQLLKWISVIPGTWADPLAFPIVYEVGKGSTMRWLRTTFRGALGGVEQFQHKFDFGKPGSDPTTTEEEALALAVDFGAKWSTAAAGGMPRFSADVKYVEVGVVEMTATDPTDAHGDGGNATESFGTQWFMWPIGLQPVGTGPGISLPFEVALAVTLQTDHRGPSGRGRAYLPPLSVNAMVAGGRYSPGIAAEAAGMVGSFFTAVAADHDLVPVVVSPRRIILNEVTSILVGAVPDSQRRRRRSQDEARVVVWAAP
jgi:hypothetical protein